MLASCGERLNSASASAASASRALTTSGEWLVRDRTAMRSRAGADRGPGQWRRRAQLAQAARCRWRRCAARSRTSMPADSCRRLPLVLCREAYLTPAAGGVACAGATYDLDADPALRASSQRRTSSGCARCCPIRRGAGAPLAGTGGLSLRGAGPPAAGRRLPDFDAAGSTERLRDVPRHPGLHGAARLCVARPDLGAAGAELLAAQLEGEPLPLEAGLVDALDPARFVLRARRNPRARSLPE
jgi:tRNA 5-methylaminomethyl-2-thiouridine biosynthesis bifunctional protein